jgi:hypothetical protein
MVKPKFLAILVTIFCVIALTAASAAAGGFLQQQAENAGGAIADTSHGAEQGAQDLGKQVSNVYHEDVLQQGDQPVLQHASEQFSTEAEQQGNYGKELEGGQINKVNNGSTDIEVGPVKFSQGTPSGGTSSTSGGTSSTDSREEWTANNGVWYHKHSSGEWHEFNGPKNPQLIGTFQETGRDNDYVYLRSANGDKVTLGDPDQGQWNKPSGMKT